MTNSLWVTLLYFFARQSHPMTNSMWVTLLYFFARQSHQSCLIGSEWHCSMTLPGSLINHISSHDQQYVSDTALSPCQADSSISLPMINREWVTTLFLCQTVSSIMSHSMTNSLWVALLYFLARQSNQSCLILWPTGSEWHCFISLPGSLISHVSSHDQQFVSDTSLFLCKAVSSIMSHPMTNRMWVTLLHFVVR